MGAFTVSTSIFDIYMMLIFGVIGYIFKKLKYPLAPLVLAIVLGDRTEEAFRQSMLSSSGSLGVFFSNGLVGSLTVLALAIFIWPFISQAMSRLKSPA